MNKFNFRLLKLSLKSLTVFDQILNDIKVTKFIGLLDSLSANEINIEKVYLEYYDFYKEMLGYNWQDYLIDLIIRSENRLSLVTDPQTSEDLKQSLLEDARRDLKIIEKTAAVKAQEIKDYIANCISTDVTQNEREVFSDDLSPDKWPAWKNSISDKTSYDLYKDGTATAWVKLRRKQLKEEFQKNRWADNLESLLDYYKEVGFGLYSEYVAFKISDSGNQLEGIDEPDPIRIENLICQEREQSIVIRNTRFFLEGLRANNIILYGNRGTGKSSLVKALLNEYADRGLRLVQLKKSQIGLFPDIVVTLSRIPLRFIVFIDDLSFDAEEEGYKSLKSLLEGGVEVKPENVLIYATSNRKHLVTESFADRKSDDVHAQDNIEEKLSLADRFGITVTFLSPDQESYLRIVEGLAEQNGINLDKDELRERAKKWTLMHNSRSGRAARQFIDHLLGELRFIDKNINY